MRPPASESENRTHGAEKIGPSQYSDFFDRIGHSRLKRSRPMVCTCPLRPESERPPTNRDVSLRAIGRHPNLLTAPYPEELTITDRNETREERSISLDQSHERRQLLRMGRSVVDHQ